MASSSSCDEAARLSMYSTADLVHCPYLPPSSLSFLGTHDDSVSGIRSSRERRQLELPAAHCRA